MRIKIVALTAVVAWVAACIPAIQALETDPCLKNPGEGWHHYSWSGPKHWESSDFPVTVVIDPGMNERQQTEVARAARWWNLKLGFNAFKVIRPSPFDFFVITLLRPERVVAVTQVDEDFINDNPDVLGVTATDLFSSTFSYVPMGLRWDEINVFYNSDEWTVRHEFGHALGLGHDDDNPESLMFPTRSGRAPGADVEQQDLEYVRSQLTCH